MSPAVAAITTTTTIAENNNFIQSSSAKLKTTGSHYTNSRGLIRYSFYVLVPLSAIAAAVFCKCNKNSRADV